MTNKSHQVKPTSRKSEEVQENDKNKEKGSGASILDNRASIITQNKSIEAISNSPQAKKTTQLQALIQGNSPVQKAEEEDPVQGKFDLMQKKGNNTGLQDNLKSGVEKLSGESLDDVQVHRNSAQPAQMQAHAFAQGNQIHLAPGQEKHLPHEAWHVAQQKQGRVQPTTHMKGDILVNDDKGLEQEADEMGEKALSSGNQ